MFQGSAARLVIDSVRYLDKVEGLNKGKTFFELRDRIVDDWMSIFNNLAKDSNFDQVYSSIHNMMRSKPKMMFIPYPLVYVKSAPKIVDLSGNRFKVYYAISVNREQPFLNPMEEYVIEYNLDAVRHGTINPNNFDFLHSFSSGASVSRISNDEFLFSITLKNMNPRLLLKAFFIFGRMGFTSNTERCIKSDVTHELIHIIDPRRSRMRKTYNISNNRAYTDHIIERASKLQDAFGEKFESLRVDIENGNMSNVIAEKAKFKKAPKVGITGLIYSKAKYQYVDKFIKENVSANWSGRLKERIEYAPGLYHYAIKAVEKFFKRAEWDRVPIFADKVVAKIRKLKRNDLNGYYMQKMEFTTQPGYYIDSIIRGTSVIGVAPDFNTTIVTNLDIFNMFFKRLNEEAFHD